MTKQLPTVVDYDPHSACIHTMCCKARRRDNTTREFVLGLTLPSPGTSGLPWKTMGPLHKEVWIQTLWTQALLSLHPLLTRQVIRTLAGRRHFASVKRVNTKPLPQKETQDRDCLFQKKVGKKKHTNTQTPRRLVFSSMRFLL